MSGAGPMAVTVVVTYASGRTRRILAGARGVLDLAARYAARPIVRRLLARVAGTYGKDPTLTWYWDRP